MFRHQDHDPKWLSSQDIGRQVFYMMAIRKIQDGGHNVSGGRGTYQKWKTKAMSSMWKKFGAFVRNVHINLLSCLTTPFNE